MQSVLYLVATPQYPDVRSSVVNKVESARKSSVVSIYSRKEICISVSHSIKFAVASLCRTSPSFFTIFTSNFLTGFRGRSLCGMLGWSG